MVYDFEVDMGTGASTRIVMTACSINPPLARPLACNHASTILINNTKPSEQVCPRALKPEQLDDVLRGGNFNRHYISLGSDDFAARKEFTNFRAHLLKGVPKAVVIRAQHERGSVPKKNASIILAPRGLTESDDRMSLYIRGSAQPACRLCNLSAQASAPAASERVSTPRVPTLLSGRETSVPQGPEPVPEVMTPTRPTMEAFRPYRGAASPSVTTSITPQRLLPASDHVSTPRPGPRGKIRDASVWCDQQSIGTAAHRVPTPRRPGPRDTIRDACDQQSTAANRVPTPRRPGRRGTIRDASVLCDQQSSTTAANRVPTPRRPGPRGNNRGAVSIWCDRRKPLPLAPRNSQDSGIPLRVHALMNGRCTRKHAQTDDQIIAYKQSYRDPRTDSRDRKRIRFKYPSV